MYEMDSDVMKLSASASPSSDTVAFAAPRTWSGALLLLPRVKHPTASHRSAALRPLFKLPRRSGEQNGAKAEHLEWVSGYVRVGHGGALGGVGPDGGDPAEVPRPRGLILLVVWFRCGEARAITFRQGHTLPPLQPGEACPPSPRQRQK